MKALVVLLPLLAGCSRFETNHTGDPKTCRERAAYRIYSAYPDPNNLGRAIDVICTGIQPPFPTTPGPTIREPTVVPSGIPTTTTTVVVP